MQYKVRQVHSGTGDRAVLNRLRPACPLLPAANAYFALPFVNSVESRHNFPPLRINIFVENANCAKFIKYYKFLDIIFVSDIIFIEIIKRRYIYAGFN